MNATELTLTSYNYTWTTERHGVHSARSTTPSEYLRSEQANKLRGEITETVSEDTYRVGQSVTVHAYGAWRQGVVTKLGRTKVTVDFQQNREGGRGQRAFQAGEIRPA